MLKKLLLILLTSSLVACSTYSPSPREFSMLEQGKRYFNAGFYKKARHILLPLACDGNSEAQYAVGYLYYYGYGVAPDTDTGYFWIDRSAHQGYPPAVKAIKMMSPK